MAAGSAAIFFSSRMSPAAFTMHTLTVSRDTSRPAKYSIFLSLGCHIEYQDSRLGPTARLLHLCRLGLDGKVPDHSTFSKNRPGRFRQSDMLRRLFETVVQRCLAEGLVAADRFAVDASLIAADANKQRSVASKDWKPEEIKENAVRAAREYLATLDNAAFGAASPVTPKFISRSDPAAQWTGAHKGHARRAKSLSNSDAPTPSPEAASQPRAQDSIAPANWIATSASSRRVAAPTRSLARSRETLTKTRATSLGLLPRRQNTRPPVGVERKSRCYSLSSSESFVWPVCV